VIINDVEGILEAAGGEITKKRFEGRARQAAGVAEAAVGRAPPAYVIGRVADARATHAHGPPAPTSSSRALGPLFAPPAGLARPGAEPAPGWDPVWPSVRRSCSICPSFAAGSSTRARPEATRCSSASARAAGFVLSDQAQGRARVSHRHPVVERELTDEARRPLGDRLSEIALISSS